MSRHLWTRVAISAVAILVAFGHSIWPRFAIDLEALALLVVAAIPWLTDIVKSLEVPGVLRVELQQIRDDLASIRGESADASQVAKAALSCATRRVPSGSPLTDDALFKLAGEYESIRARQKPGKIRTAAMTDIVGQMIGLSSRLSATEVRQLLKDERDGQRLIAYAHLYARPQPEFIPELVDSVTRIERRAFGQYWGIQAIGRIAQVEPASLTPDMVSQLRKFSLRFDNGTDRLAALRAIVGEGAEERRRDKAETLKTSVPSHPPAYSPD